MSDDPASALELNYRARFVIDRICISYVTACVSRYSYCYYRALRCSITPMDHAIASMRVIHASRNEAINGATKRVYVALSQRFHALRAVTTSMLGGSYFYVAQYGLRFTAIGRISASRGCLYAFVLSFKLPRGQYPERLKPQARGFTL